MKAIDQQVEKSPGMIELLLKGGITASIVSVLDGVAEELEARGEVELEQETSLISEALAQLANPEFSRVFRQWFDAARKAFKDYMKNGKEDLDYTDGKKYIRIFQITAGGQKYAWAFIDKTTGDVLKPDGWKRPAKHARGNIFDEHGGMKFVGPFGPAYLR